MPAGCKRKPALGRGFVSSGAHMTARVIQTNTNTLLITHGGVIAAIMAELFEHEKKSRKPGGGYLIDVAEKTYQIF